MQTPDSKLEFHEQVKSQPVPGELEFQQHMEKQIAEQTAKKKLFQMLDMKDMPSWKKAVLYIMAGIMLVSMSASILLTLYNMIRGDSFATILVGVPILAFISFVIWHARNRTDDIDSSLRMAEELEKRKAK